MERETLEKLYAGLIGMDAGMRLGAPVENPFWTYERLQSYYGDIRGYLREQRYYTADDDVNGPLIFVRALADNAMPETLAPETVGETWLNYTRRGMGMFWWGGEDVSTEHRAYMNLRRGVKAPRSGSIEENGKDRRRADRRTDLCGHLGAHLPRRPGARCGSRRRSRERIARRQRRGRRAVYGRVRRRGVYGVLAGRGAGCRFALPAGEVRLPPRGRDGCAPTTAHTRRKRIFAPAAR